MLENKIAKAQENVTKTRAKYETATAELKEPLDKKKAIQTNEIVRAVSKSSRSHEEFLAYILSAD